MSVPTLLGPGQIVDHLRLLANLSPLEVLYPLKPPPHLEKQVRELAWTLGKRRFSAPELRILGVEDMVLNTPQRGSDRAAKPPRRLGRPWCCRRAARAKTEVEKDVEV